MSKSIEAGTEWIAGAWVYSGRPDPTWTVDSERAAELIRTWGSLSPATGTAAPPPLGYRGCWLRDPQGREWHAFGGTVTRKGAGQEESRGDGERGFEKQLLDTGPADALPPFVKESL